MTVQIAVVFLILGGALTLFALDRYPVDFVALAILSVMLILAPWLGMSYAAVISGFSNTATITVMAMFILSGAITKTGMINWLAVQLLRMAGRTERRQLLSVFGVVGPVSAFLNNTATVAILMPVVISLARSNRRAPSKLLIPLSYGAQLGGVMTLIGTSTNVLAAGMLTERGMESFSMFSFSRIGIFVFITGVLYFLTVGIRLLPNRESPASVAERFALKEFLAEVAISPGSHFIGQRVQGAKLDAQLDMAVVGIIRDNLRLDAAREDYAVQSGDVLLVKTTAAQLAQMSTVRGLSIDPYQQTQRNGRATPDLGLLEVVIGPNSWLIGSTLRETHFRQRYNCSVVAMRKHGELVADRLGDIRLEIGDVLLLHGTTAALDRIRQEPDLVVTEQAPLSSFRTEKMPVALAIVLGVLGLAVYGVPIIVTAIAGSVLMVLTGCLRMHELHESIRWDVIFLLAGVLPLGLAMETTGGAQLLADWAVRLTAGAAPLLLLYLFYGVAMLLTEIISNNATVVVLLPIALATAQSVGISPYPLVLCVMFAASTSFMTPVGYQTNAMIYGPGGYRFLDFFRVGAPLNLLLWGVTPYLIYIFWGL